MIPFPYRVAALMAIIFALFGAGYWQGHRVEHAAWEADTAKREKAEAFAIIARTAENAKLAAQQQSTNVTITKVKNEELTPVRERIVTRRVYVGTGLCAGSAGAPEAQGAAGGDSANPPGRLVRPDIERDLVALKLAVEEDLATGRACQTFITKNGLTP